LQARGELPENSKVRTLGQKRATQGGFVSNYVIVTSASLYKKADDLEYQALSATSPAQAAIFRRVAKLKRVAAELIRITEVSN
jgi:threonine dehydrogenase-like Zn-dependent dehydrogenase